MPSVPVPAVRVKVPAKVNLHLTVGPLRADGFHELHTVFHAVDLIDEVIASATRAPRLTVTGRRSGVPTDRTNIAWRAVELLAGEADIAPDVRLRVHKRIPVAGGMAGGSADAAGALLACRALWDLDVPDDRLAELAAELGSDVAFPLLGGTAVGTGRGEVLRPVALPALHWVFVPDEHGISAGDAYRELDRLRAAGTVPEPAGAPSALLAARDAHTVAALLTNDLQAAALSLRPALGDTLTDGLAAGALAGIVSGSGPTCAFLFATRGDAEAAAQQLRGRHPGVLVASGPVTPQVCR